MATEQKVPPSSMAPTLTNLIEFRLTILFFNKTTDPTNTPEIKTLEKGMINPLEGQEIT